MEIEYLNHLKHQVEQTFGKKILASADCRDLCMDISQWAGNKISFSTAKRLFNLLKEEHLPSVYTLNILSNYCGFSSFDDFVATQKRSFFENGQENAFIDFLIMLFKNVDVSNGNDITYISLVQQTIKYLEQYSGIVDRFLREIARTRNGQIYYFEKFVNIDKLNSFYGEGLYYYLHEKKTKEAKIFGHSLLCLRSWLSMNDAGVENQWNALKGITIDPSIRPAVCARYFSAELYAANISVSNVQSIISKARLYYTSQPSTKEADYNCFELIIAKCLTLIGECDEAQYYIEEVLKKINTYTFIPSGIVDVSLFETISLYKAIALAQCGEHQQSMEMLNGIVPYKFSFLSKQYLTILYLSLKNSLKFRSIESEQIQYLIRETGFKRLSYLFLVPGSIIIANPDKTVENLL